MTTKISAGRGADRSTWPRSACDTGCGLRRRSPAACPPGGSGKLVGQVGQLLQLAVEPLDLDVVEHPVLRRCRPGGPAPGPPRSFRPCWCSLALSAIGNPSRIWHSSWVRYSRERLLDLVQIGAELVADHWSPSIRWPTRVGVSGQSRPEAPAACPSVIRQSPTWRLSLAASGNSTARQLSGF